MNVNIPTLTGLFLAFAAEEVVFVTLVLKQTAVSNDGAPCRNLPDCRCPISFTPHGIRVLPCAEQVVICGEERIRFVEEGQGREEVAALV